MDALKSKHFDDVYFSAEDGLAESRHVFLAGNNLPAAWQGREQFTICETGFGTGRNFLNTWKLFDETAAPNQQLHYYSFEKFPLSSAEIKDYLASWAVEFGGRLAALCAKYPLRVGGWHTLRLTDQITLTLIFDDVNRALPELDATVDCWFLDGHAPAKNPDIWSDILFENMARLSVTGARFATYTAAVFVRKKLEDLGFLVEKAPGFGRKKDMTVGQYMGDYAAIAVPSKPQRVAIIGGGVAGAACAFELAMRGVDVHLFEKNHIASGGSGNPRGLFNPRFAAFKGFESDFYGPAFSRGFQNFSTASDIGFRSCGSLHLITDDDKRKRFMAVAANWGWHDDHLMIVSAEEASCIAGIALVHDALYLPDAGFVAPFRATQALATKASVHNVDIVDIVQIGAAWQVDGQLFDVVIIAGGKDVARFTQTSSLPVQAVRGQISVINTPQTLKGLRANLCYGGYAIPDVDGEMVVGSTFQHWLHEEALRDADHVEVIGKLQKVTPSWGEEEAVVRNGRASFRCAARDRVPIIGALPDYAGLYVTAAHGSHGLLSSQMGAAMLAAHMCGEGQVLPRSVMQRLSPSRFHK